MPNTNHPPKPAPPPVDLERARIAWALRLIALLSLIAMLWFTWQWLDQRGTLANLGAGAPVAAATGTDAQIVAFFTTPHLVYPDNPDRRTPMPHETQIIADLDAAQRRIQFVTFEYNLPSIAAALARAQQRGVAVETVLDGENLAKPAMDRWARTLEAAGVAIVWEDTDAFMHSKFIIIDDRVLWTGSWNATENDTYRNNNNLLRITAPELIANYQVEFAQLQAGVASTAKQARSPHPELLVGAVEVANYFAPQDRVEEQIIARIASARQSVRFLAFAFTSDPIYAALLERVQAGVPVSGVFEQRNAETPGADYDRMRRNRFAVRKDGNCYTMHHKVMIIDERIVITGSFNFTRRANELNVENLLIIDDPTLAAAYVAEFERVWQQAENPPRCG